MRVLVLGGTGEARALADRLQTRSEVAVISSLAGHGYEPRLPTGEVRIGGFGGIDGLAGYLAAEDVRAVIDATHPFAARITEHAIAACARVGVSLLVLRRPGWTAVDGDRWHRVATVADAAALVAGHNEGLTSGGAVLLTTGRRDLAAFTADDRHHYVVRTVDPPDLALPPRHTLLRARGPFTLQGELTLLRQHRIELLISKDSGGHWTAAKLVAARELGLPVVLVDRPALPPAVDVATTVHAADQWLMTAVPGRRARSSLGSGELVEQPTDGRVGEGVADDAAVAFGGHGVVGAQEPQGLGDGGVVDQGGGGEVGDADRPG
jgi:precorrin-6A/cobalt-precorrin-6A reductase